MPDAALSAREREIARAYAAGETYQQIAGRLCIAPSTVRTHLATIYRKLGISSKLDLHKVLDGDRPSARSEHEQAQLVSELALSLEEAISRERALSAVLSIIARSAGEVDEVIAAVLGYALDLCDAEFGVLFDYRPRDGFRAAHARNIPPSFRRWFAEQDWFQVDPRTGLGRVVDSLAVVNIADVCGEAVYRDGDPLRAATADLGGARSFTAIPMLAGGRLIGAFTIYRKQVRPFDDKSLALARMFADQSAIAIENARLVSALRARH